jgi:hypothetical protein
MPAATALGEHEIEGGFRRVSPEPEAQALLRLRALLLDVARDGGPLLRQGIDGFQSWQSVATLCGTEWTAGAMRGSTASRRVLRRRLQGLGIGAITVERAADLPAGTPVHLRGSVRPVLPSRLNAHISHIWSRSAMTTDNVRVTVEEGHDFFLVGPRGAGRDTGVASAVRVIAARGYLLNADTLIAGDRVSVFGFTDRTPAPTDVASRSASELAVRAGDDEPLLIRRLAADQ